MSELAEKQPLLLPSTSQKDASRPLIPTHVKPSRKSTFRRQMFLGLAVALPSVPCGMSLGFSAITFDEINFTVDEASWFASVTAMAYPFGAIAIGPFMDKCGRRPALLSINIVSFIGWLMLSVQTSNPAIFKLITGRLLTGIAGGLASVPAAVYAAECLESVDLSSRSSLVSWSTVALSGGIFLVYTSGTILEYFAVASIATLISIISFIIIVIFVPESPAWYNMKGRPGDAEWALREININPPPAPIEEPSEAEDVPGRLPPPLPPIPPSPAALKELIKPEAYKPLLILIGFFFFQQFSGVFVMIAYMVDIIRTAGVVTVNPYIVTAIGGTIILLVSILASMVYPKIGVRALAVISGAGTTLTMLLMGAFLSLRVYWIYTDDWQILNWIPFFVILSTIGVSTVGFLILPWSMLGELFPLSVKGIAASIATCLGFIFSFVAAKVYPYIQLGLGVQEVFYFFGVMALFGTVYVIIFLPETRGKTLQQIVEEYSRPKSRKQYNQA